MKFEVTNTPTVSVPLNAQAMEWVRTMPAQTTISTVDPNGATTDLNLSITATVHSSHLADFEEVSSLTFYLSHLPSDAPTGLGTIDALGVTLVFGHPSETNPDRLAGDSVMVPIDRPVTLHLPLGLPTTSGIDAPAHLKSATLTEWWVDTSGHPV